MLFTKAMGVFWQTLKDTWEELLQLAVMNLMWTLSWGLPLALSNKASSSPALFFGVLVFGVALFALATVGILYTTNIVARGRTIHLSDFFEGVKKYWWRSLLWALVNIAVIAILVFNVLVYPKMFQGFLGVLLGGLCIAAMAFWAMMQMYFWPLMFHSEEPKILRAWRNAAYLLFANPFYGILMAMFVLVMLLLSGLLTLILMFAGMTLVGLLCNNATITLLVHFKIIENPRPELPKQY